MSKPVIDDDWVRVKAHVSSHEAAWDREWNERKMQRKAEHELLGVDKYVAALVELAKIDKWEIPDGGYPHMKITDENLAAVLLLGDTAAHRDQRGALRARVQHFACQWIWGRDALSFFSRNHRNHRT